MERIKFTENLNAINTAKKNYINGDTSDYKIVYFNVKSFKSLKNKTDENVKLAILTENIFRVRKKTIWHKTFELSYSNGFAIVNYYCGSQRKSADY